MLVSGVGSFERHNYDTYAVWVLMGHDYCMDLKQGNFY